MRLRATLASFLTLILVSLPSVAANCEIKCGLAQTLPSCHTSGVQAKAGQQAQAQEQMANMPGMEHMGAADQDSEALVSVVTALDCRAHVCAQQPAFFSEQKAVVAHASVSTEAVFFDSFQFAPELLNTEVSSRGPPLLHPSTPITLHTTLRV